MVEGGGCRAGILRDFLLMALFTGMRRGELMRLRWENVDLAARTLHLPTTKTGDPLNLPLATYLADLLTKRKKQAGRSPFVFPARARMGIWWKRRSSCCVSSSNGDETELPV